MCRHVVGDFPEQAGAATTMNRAMLRALGATAAMMTAGWAGAVQAPSLAALGQLEAGEWELHERGETSMRRLCVQDMRQFLHLRHPAGSCRDFVVSDAAEAGSVTYDCAAAGNGRTDIRIETPRLVQIRTQGIAGGAPFSVEVEGRRIGACR